MTSGASLWHEHGKWTDEWARAVVARSRLVQSDISLSMTECRYPRWNGGWKVTAAPVKDGRPGVELTGTWTIENADEWKTLELGICAETRG